MRSRPNNRTRRSLRSVGRALLRLSGPTWPLALAAPPSPTGAALLSCPSCDSRLMCPMDWGVVDVASWWLRSRCGDCEVWMELEISNEQAAFLDCALDREMQQIRRAADRLDAERMAEAADAFARALHDDLIVAGDF